MCAYSDEYGCIFTQFLLFYHCQVHSEKRFTCKSCHYASTRRANLVRHIQRCHMKRPHMCKECNRTFKTEMMLKSHENLHARHEVLKCNQCSYTTLLQTSLKDHLQVVHTGNLSGASQQPEPMVPSDMFVCECGVFFDSQHNLTQHRAMFHGSPQGGANAQLDVSYPIAMEMHTSQSGAGSDFLRHGGPFVSGVANFIPVPTRDLTRGVDTAMSRQNLAETSLKLPLIKAEPKEDYADHSSAPGLPFGDRRAAQESYPSALHVNVSRSSRGISAVTPLFSNVSPRNSAVSQARASYPNPNSSGTPAKPTQYDRRDLESTLDHFESTGALFRCKLCCIFFTDRTMYILHRGLHNSQNDLQCSLCCHISRDKLDFASHFISAHK